MSLLLLSTVWQNACVVARVYVVAPARLPPKTLGTLSRPITFDVCLPEVRPPIVDVGRRATANLVQRAFAEAGVTAEFSLSGSAPVDVTITLLSQFHGDTSTALSGMSFSIIPGYGGNESTLEVDLAWAGDSQVRRTDHLRYQSREHYFIWLPLIVYPDLIATAGGVWERSEKQEAGLRRMVWRLADDIRLRVAHDGAVPPIELTGGVSCP